MCRVLGGEALQAACYLLPVDDEGYGQVLVPLAACVAELHVGADGGRAVVVVGRSRDIVVADVGERAHPELYGSEDAAEAPHVNVLEIGAVAPSIDLHSEAVLSFANITCDVELGRRHGVLAVAHALTVHPHVEGRLDAGEVEDEVLRQLLARNIYKGDVRAHRVAVVVGIPILWRLAGHAGRVTLKRIL